jgi:ABC-2 type transport system ATP-binding protein
MANAIEVVNLKKNFVLPLTRKRIKALDGLSFSLREGGIVGFLGANGAGKTTTLKIILRLIFPDSGDVRIFGQSNSNFDLKKDIGFLTERPYFYDHLTGREFLRFCAQLFGTKEALQRVEPLLEEVGLTHGADRSLRRYSKGMLQRIGIAQALINNPKLLILDEPMSGLDPDGRAEISKIIARAHQKGTTVIFSTHLLPDVESLCDRVVMIDKGRLVVESSVADLIGSQSKGFKLEIRRPSNDYGSLEKFEFNSEEELQHSIDKFRKEGARISTVLPLRPTLEEVFLKLKKEQR